MMGKFFSFLQISETSLTNNVNVMILSGVSPQFKLLVYILWYIKSEIEENIISF